MGAGAAPPTTTRRVVSDFSSSGVGPAFMETDTAGEMAEWRSRVRVGRGAPGANALADAASMARTSVGRNAISSSFGPGQPVLEPLKGLHLDVKSHSGLIYN
jgi:hypothetical protein